jgi:hypothetical protein
MQTKLTLRLDKSLVDLAKNYSANHGKSVSKMVADYFILLKESSNQSYEEITPITKSLKASLGKAELNENDYLKHLEEKYL